MSGCELSVVILTYNQYDRTRLCLQSLTTCMLPFGSEIIVVDNGSADDSVRRLNDEFAMVRYISLPHNLGVAAGRNRGIAAACGKYIMILDNDTLPRRECVVGLVQYMQTHPHTAIAAPRLIYPDGTTQPSARRYPGIVEKIRNIVSGGRLSPTPCYVIGACQIFRRELWQRIGPLDERIFYGPEDADFCLRARVAGTIDYVDSFVMVHDHRRITRRKLLSPMARRHMSALLYFWRKHHRWL